ncbi:conserved membrane hypothetical protein [Candidatus Desulfarcum epimagneticum]|uniref:Phage holin family protein n=1 Tax=uncultured Desulfobacteraceae bacterium TaxID=218296 RepID=A0A484HJA2_9BACT|nr:conserved membrane hypothetical protein [uncultured Desulfobacteraceae bacterium]
MKGILIRWLVLTGAVIICAFLLDGIRVSGFLSALFAAAMLGILNAFFRPVALILTLPLNLLTLGLFTFVVNAAMLKMVSAISPGFQVSGFWPAVFGSLLISAASWLLNSFINGRGGVGYIDLKHRGRGRDHINLKRRGPNRWE